MSELLDEAQRMARITERQVDLVLAELEAIELAQLEADEVRAFSVSREANRRPYGLRSAAIIPFRCIKRSAPKL